MRPVVAGGRDRDRARACSRESPSGVPSTITRPSCIIVTRSATTERDVHVVLDEDQGDLRIEREQQIGEHLTLAAREARGRLVEHEELRLGRERHRDRDLPMLAVREARRPQSSSLWSIATRCAACAGPLAHRPVLCGRTTGRSWPRPTPEDREIDQSSTDDTEKQARLLVRAREPESRAAFGRRARVTSRAEASRRFPLDGGMSPADHVEERGLPGSVRAEDRPTLAVSDVEIDVGHCTETPEPPADPPQAEGRLGVFEGLCYFAQRPT